MRHHYERRHGMNFLHGTYNGYRKGCRCDRCHEAMCQKVRWYRESLRRRWMPGGER